MLPTPYQELIYKRSYSRWLPEEKRREEWDETVDRYAEFFFDKLPFGIPTKYLLEFDAVMRSIRDLQVMPSMRALWSAGDALEFDNLAGFNCAYTEVSSVRKFAEILYILMNGTGVGVSVERQVIAELPAVPDEVLRTQAVIVFEDSKEGWAEGYLEYLEDLWQGNISFCNLSKIRPKGARLKTFGGRASGPEPLQDLLNFTLKVFQGARGRKLNSEEVADIICKIAEIVVVGGVRRSAILLLTNPSDRRMANYKQGEFWLKYPHRSLANVSAVYTEKPAPVVFLEDFLSLMRSGTGERGIINRESLQKSAEKCGRNPKANYGLNPCGEVILEPNQLCNLTEVVARPTDMVGDLMRKVRHATILGTLQATLSYFRFLGPEWKENTERERLLGVSITGLMDCPKLSDPNNAMYDSDYLRVLRNTAHKANEEWSELLGIAPAKAVTCVKPSGTVSQLVNSSSGLHPRFSPHYIRRVRIARTDPITAFLISKGVPWQPETGSTVENYSTAVFEFPHKSPPEAQCVKYVDALDQLRYFLKLKKEYTDHNPSCTIYVKESEWVSVASWVWTNWDYVGGITFLPADQGVYQLAPYEEITGEQYEERVAAFPELNFTELSNFEYEDCTEGSREYACVGGSCDV